MAPRDLDDFAYEYVLGKLGEVDDALSALDARTDPLEYAERRRYLVQLQARLISALAAFDADRVSMN